MREIKFRYWDIFNGHMIYLKNVRGETLQMFFHHYEKAKSGGNNPILEQYTGLKDKNGVDIYEGDVWERGGFIAVVTFEYSGWNLSKTESSKSYQYPSFYSNAKTGVVTGNIHENPELLEEK